MKHKSKTFRHFSSSIIAIMLLLLFYSCFYEIEDEIIKDEAILMTSLIIPTSHNNPRNSEGDFISLNDGQIMFIYSRFIGNNGSDFTSAVLAARFSNDDGRTWSKDDKIIIENEGIMNVMSVSLLRLYNGDIALFYSIKNSLEDCKPVMRISKDEAKTWSTPVPIIIDKNGYFVLNNDRVIQLKNGRLLVPVAQHNKPGDNWSDRGKIYCYYSDDNGKSWNSSMQIPYYSDIILQEPGLIELNDDGIMMYIRASGGFQQISFSFDNGHTWTPVKSSNIQSPLSPALIKPIPGTQNWIIFWNNNYIPEAPNGGERNVLRTAISKDNGKTWINEGNILEYPDGSFDYPAIHFLDSNKLLISIRFNMQCYVFLYKYNLENIM